MTAGSRVRRGCSLSFDASPPNVLLSSIWTGGGSNEFGRFGWDGLKFRGDCYDPMCLCPGGIGLSFLEWPGLVQIVQDPRSTHSFCPTDLPRSICDMCHGLAYVILFISLFWSKPRFCMFSSIWPSHSIFRTSLLFYFLCLTLMLTRSTLIVYYLYLLFSISSYAFNHSSISMHVIFLLVLQYGNQLRLLHLLILAPTFTLLWPSEIEELFWNPWNYWCSECTRNHQRVFTMMSWMRRGI